MPKLTFEEFVAEIRALSNTYRTMLAVTTLAQGMDIPTEQLAASKTAASIYQLCLEDVEGVLAKLEGEPSFDPSTQN